MLETNAFHSGINLMLPHLVASAKVLGIYGNWSSGIQRVFGTNTRLGVKLWGQITVDLIEQLKEGLLAFKPKMQSKADVKLLEALVASMDADIVKSVYCKAVHVLKNFVTVSSLTNWRSEKVPELRPRALTLLDTAGARRRKA